MIDRRALLAGLSAALTADLSASATTHASGAESTPEHPDLIEMSNRLPGVLQVYNDAAGHVQTIAQTWGPQWPKPDLRIVAYGPGTERHADILGFGIKTQWGATPDTMRVQNLGTPAYFEAEHRESTKEAERQSKIKSKRGANYEMRRALRSKACIEPARAYWSEVERIETASGIKDALAARDVAHDALCGLVGDILTFEEATALGLGIKTLARAAFITLPLLTQMAHPDYPKWMAGLAKTLTRWANAHDTAERPHP
ncbi:MAG: hypothetical protein ACFB03_19500 [Paracoccaceae bacterium]